MKDKKTRFNPALILFLGAAPALGATVDVRAGLGLGLAALLVMLLSTLVLLALRKLIPEGARLPAAILVSAGFTSLIGLMMNAFFPTVYGLLGLYLSVLAVNLLVFAQAESLSVKHSLVSGLAFLGLVLVTALLREVFGAASFAGIGLSFLAEYKIPLLLKAPGGLVIYAFVAALAGKLFGGELSLGGLTGQASGIAKEGE